MSYLDLPPDASMLYALKSRRAAATPGSCGMQAAWAALPEPLKARLAGRRIKHDGTYNSGGYRAQRRDADRRSAPGAGRVASGRDQRIRSPACRRSISGAGAIPTSKGLSPAESDALLDELWTQRRKPELRYEHRWRIGDLVLWDNRSTMHRRDPFDNATRRVMHRTQIKGTRQPRAFVAAA